MKNYILGGGSFTSRLYSEIRGKRGLVYSVYSSLYPMDHSALIIGNAGSANARVAETLSVIAGILLGMKIPELGIECLDRHNELIKEVTKEDVNRIAKKILNAEHMLTMVVGQPEGVTSTQ